jgi:ParB family chromosome partitioning protein
MKAAENLIARLGANIAESMGPASAAPTTPSSTVLHGEAAKYKGAARLKDALAIKLDQIIPDPEQPRKEFDSGSLAELAESLKTRGQLQPCRVRYSAEAGKWVIVVGERRYRAAIMAGLPTLLCIESTTPQSADDILEDQLVENCLRADLLPVEQATAFKALMERRGWSTRQLGEALHISSGHITRALALLDLPGDIQAKVTAGELPASTAYELRAVEDADQQRQLAERITSEGMSRAEVVEEVRKVAPKSKGRGATKARSKGKTSRLPAEMKQRASRGSRVVIQTTAKLTLADVIADLREIADRLEAELGSSDNQQAA